jgi:hypothetical protein
MERAQERAVRDRDQARREAEQLRAVLAEGTRPAIQALPLDESDAGLRPLPISTDAPRTLALRRIHLMNHGESTLLRDWEVWTTLQGQSGPSGARVISRQEWEPMSRVLGRESDVPVACKGDVVRAMRHSAIKRDIPFVVEGLLPDDLSAPGNIVQVTFVDGTNRPWRYGERPLMQRRI